MNEGKKKSLSGLLFHSKEATKASNSDGLGPQHVAISCHTFRLREMCQDSRDDSVNSRDHLVLTGVLPWIYYLHAVHVQALECVEWLRGKRTSNTIPSHTGTKI
jgi:hypothetical protein